VLSGLFVITLPAPAGTLGTGFPLYVAYYVNNEIIKVDANGNQTVFSSNNSQQGTNLAFPQGLAFDASGNLYVASAGNGEVLKLDANGNQTVFYNSGGFQQGFYPIPLAFDASGNLYVGNNYGLGTIVKLDAYGGLTVFSSNNPQRGTNLFEPYSLAFGACQLEALFA
jgi:DNA-binding beta-propeller fold protein YncE